VNGASIEAVQGVWMASLAVFLVVLVVVAVLLTMIVGTARGILGGVEAIWNTGQRIANNTVHIVLLKQTNLGAGAILESAGGIVSATAAITAHAESCSGCPRCVLAPGWSP
jgi:hypothetical protein